VGKVAFAIENIEVEGESVACLVRNGSEYIDLESLGLFFDLALLDEDAYEAVCQLVNTWLDTARGSITA